MDPEARLRVVFYRTEAGNEPVREWLREICEATGGRMNAKHIGSDFDDFLAQEGLLAESEAVALKRVLAFQISELMREQKLSRAAMAKRMKTTRSTLARLLDSPDTPAALETLERAASALGKRLRVQLV